MIGEALAVKSYHLAVKNRWIITHHGKYMCMQVAKKGTVVKSGHLDMRHQSEIAERADQGRLLEAIYCRSPVRAASACRTTFKECL